MYPTHKKVLVITMKEAQKANTLVSWLRLATPKLPLILLIIRMRKPQRKERKRKERLYLRWKLPCNLTKS